MHLPLDSDVEKRKLLFLNILGVGVLVTDTSQWGLSFVLAVSRVFKLLSIYQTGGT